MQYRHYHRKHYWVPKLLMIFIVTNFRDNKISHIDAADSFEEVRKSKNIVPFPNLSSPS